MPILSTSNAAALRRVLPVALLLSHGGAVLRAQEAGSCIPERRAASKLRLEDGHAVYIEPMAFARTAHSWLLAGEPMYVWSYPSGRRPELDTSHALIGVLQTAGAVRAFPKPPVGRVATHFRIRDVGNEFVAVFAETNRSSVGMPSAHVLAYWYARTDGRAWRALERLSLPPDSLDAAAATPLVQVGDDLMLAVPYGHVHDRRVAVYVRTRRGWSRDDLFVRSAVYLAAAVRSGRPLLYVVRPDSTRLPDSNSLFLFVRDSQGWRDAGVVVRGGSRPIHRPVVTAVADAQILSWREEGEVTGVIAARAARIRDDGTLGEVLTLAQGIEDVVPVRGSTNAFRWVVTRRAADGSATHELVELAPTGPVLLDAVIDPFTGPFLAHATDDGEVIVGPVVSHEATDEFLVSGIVRLQRRCDERAAR